MRKLFLDHDRYNLKDVMVLIQDYQKDYFVSLVQVRESPYMLQMVYKPKIKTEWRKSGWTWISKLTPKTKKKLLEIPGITKGKIW